MENSIDEIEIPVWYKNGTMLFNRDCLPFNHPESTYNFIKNKLNKIPENYGVFNPTFIKYKNKSREELISIISDLENEIESYTKHFT